MYRQRVLVVEPHANGHHGPYLGWMVSGLLEWGFEVTLVTLPETLEHPALKAVKDASGAQDSRVRVIVSRESAPDRLGQRIKIGRKITQEFDYWRLFKRWYAAESESRSYDQIFLPYADYCLYAISILGSPFGETPWVGLAMRPTFHYRELGVVAPRSAADEIKRLLFVRVLRDPRLRRLITIDETMAEYLSHRLDCTRKGVFLPDPPEFTVLPDRAVAKQTLGLPPKRKMILVYGAIGPRKGVLELLRALGSATFPSYVDVLLAGKLTSMVRDALSAGWVRDLVSQRRLIVCDRYIDQAEAPTVFAAADIVWLGYRGHYTASGVLIQAAAVGLPVLACEEGLIGWQTKRHELGEVIHPQRAQSIIDGINALQRKGKLSPSANDGLTSAFGQRSMSNAHGVLAQAFANR